jgi:hypothetical protein
VTKFTLRCAISVKSSDEGVLPLPLQGLFFGTAATKES